MSCRRVVILPGGPDQSFEWQCRQGTPWFSTSRIWSATPVHIWLRGTLCTGLWLNPQKAMAPRKHLKPERSHWLRGRANQRTPYLSGSRDVLDAAVAWFSDDPDPAEGCQIEQEQLPDHCEPDPDSAREITLNRNYITQPARCFSHESSRRHGDVGAARPNNLRRPRAAQAGTGRLIERLGIGSSKDANARPIDRAVSDRKRAQERLAEFVAIRDAVQATEANAVRGGRTC